MSDKQDRLQNALNRYKGRNDVIPPASPYDKYLEKPKGDGYTAHYIFSFLIPLGWLYYWRELAIR